MVLGAEKCTTLFVEDEELKSTKCVCVELSSGHRLQMQLIARKHAKYTNEATQVLKTFWRDASASTFVRVLRETTKYKQLFVMTIKLCTHKLNQKKKKNEYLAYNTNTRIRNPIET